MANIMELQLQQQSLQWIFRVDFLSDWLVPCSLKDSQESSPAPQLESINSLILSFLYGSTVTSVHYWKKTQLWLYGHLLAKQCLCFLILCVCLRFPFKDQVYFNFMAVITVHGDFGAQEKLYCFSYCFSAYLHEVMDLMPMILLFWILSFTSAFSLSSFNFIKTLFHFCHKGSIICISLVFDISKTRSLDFSLWFVQPGNLYAVLCIEV